MNAPTKQELKDTIEHLREDLFLAIDQMDGCQLQANLLLKYPEWYDWYFEREAEERIFNHPLAQ